jgi:isoleucyl-tRNA synthetase
LDRWVMDRAFALQTEVKTAYESYQFQHIYQKVHHFCVIDLGGFYLDIIKDRQYTQKPTVWRDVLHKRPCIMLLKH